MRSWRLLADCAGKGVVGGWETGTDLSILGKHSAPHHPSPLLSYIQSLRQTPLGVTEPLVFGYPQPGGVETGKGGRLVKDVMRIYNGSYSGIGNDEILPFGTTWVGLERIMLSKVRQRRTRTI